VWRPFSGTGNNTFTGVIPTKYSMLTNVYSLTLVKVVDSYILLCLPCLVNQYKSLTLFYLFVGPFDFIIKAGNNNLWGNISPLFCGIATNYMTIHSDFEQMDYLENL
jgi:hypothetical protein